MRGRRLLQCAGWGRLMGCDFAGLVVRRPGSKIDRQAARSRSRGTRRRQGQSEAAREECLMPRLSSHHTVDQSRHPIGSWVLR